MPAAMTQALSNSDAGGSTLGSPSEKEQSLLFRDAGEGRCGVSLMPPVQFWKRFLFSWISSDQERETSLDFTVHLSDASGFTWGKLRFLSAGYLKVFPPEKLQKK